MKIKGVVTILLVVSLLIGTLATTAGAVVFGDTEGSWAENYIDYWSDQKVVQGYGDNQFLGSNYITRGETASILQNLLGLPAASTNKSYPDIDPNAWYYDAFMACVAAGIFQGDANGYLRPADPITRTEGITVIARATNLASGSDSATGIFADAAQVPLWARGYWSLMITLGTVEGYAADNTLKPQNLINRNEFTKLLFKTQEKGGGTKVWKTSFASGTTTKDWTTTQEIEVWEAPKTETPTPAPAPIITGGGGGGGGGTTTYRFDVCITKISDSTKTVSDSLTQLTSDTPVLPNLVQLITVNRNNFDTVFADPDAAAVMADGLEAYNRTTTGTDTAAWGTYLTSLSGIVTGNGVSLLSNLYVALADMIIGTNYTLNYGDYSVTISKTVS